MTPSTTKRVQIIVDSLNVAGTELHILRTFSELSVRGYSVSLIVCTPEGTLLEKAIEAGFEVLVPKKRNVVVASLPPLIGKIIHLFESISRDPQTIVCAYLPRAYLATGILHLLMRLPNKLLYFRRSLNDYQKKHRFLSWVERHLHRHSDFIVANSNAIAHQLTNEEGVSSSKVRLIYNGLDVKQFLRENPTGDIRRELSIPASTIILTVVANLIPYKGHRDLLIALSLLPANHHDSIHVVFVGGGYEARTDLHEFMVENRIDSIVTALGSRADVSQILRASNIGILCPYENEGFSNAVLEKMAAGLPMIVTDVGGNAEAVVNNVTGLVVPPQNPELLANALEKLITDKDLRHAMGKAGSERVAKQFSLDACAHAYDALLREVAVN